MPNRWTEDRRARQPMVIAGAVAAVGLTGIAATVATAVISLAASMAISFVMGKLFAPKMPRQPDQKRELGRPQSLPPYRFVYGHSSAFGSPAPFVEQDSDDDIIWGCLIFNSRPSAGTNLKLLVDKREVTWTGDPFDFSATGGAEVQGPGKLNTSLRFWLGLGDQTAPPAQAVADTQFTSADAWQGLTVLWVRLIRGDPEDRAERWPAWPPEFELVMDWSKVWNPNDAAQSLGDPTTWTFSDNRALCVLDALTQNPLRPYREINVHLDSFKAAALVDAEAVLLKAGGTEPRNRVSGVLVWDDREVHEQVEPLVTAGGDSTDLVRIGGKLGLVADELPESVVTVTDLIADGTITRETLKPGRDLASRVSTSYVNPDRDWQMADLPLYEVPGAVSEDGGVPSVEHLELDFVPSHAQAARRQKRRAYRLREQKRITATLPPAAFDLVAGSGVTLALPAPWSKWNGLYQVKKIAPRLIEEDDDGVTLRCPAELVEVLAEGYSWDKSEEPDIGIGDAVDTTPTSLPQPTFIALSDHTTALNDGDTVHPRIRITADRPVTTQVGFLDVRYREKGASVWDRASQPRIAQWGTSDTTVIYITPVSVGTIYEIEARWVGAGRTSAWSTTVEVTAQAAISAAPNVPTNGSATGEAGQISVSYAIGNDVLFRSIEFFSSATNDPATATVFHGPIYGSPNTTYGATETGLGSGVTRYYWAKAVGPYGNRSAFSAGVSATTT